MIPAPRTHADPSPGPRAALLQVLAGSIAPTPIATVITDPKLPDNPLVVVNRAFEQLTGYPSAEILGRNCRLLQGRGTEPTARAALADAVAGARAAVVSMTNYRRDGTPFQNAVMIAPVLDEAGALAFFVGSQMDLGSSSGQLTSRRGAAQAAVARLTPRQRQVLEYLIGGYRNKQIAGALGIDEKTVKMHRASLLARLNAPTSADAIRIGVEAELPAAGSELKDR